MTRSRIIRHAEPEEAADDSEHPIPALGVVDVNTVKSSGGADLHIVVASPMQADEKSQVRLLAKLEGYFEFIQSTDFRREAGSPNPDNTCIVVQIHAESEAGIFELLERCKPWALENGATLMVHLLDQSVH